MGKVPVVQTRVHGEKLKSRIQIASFRSSSKLYGTAWFLHLGVDSPDGRDIGHSAEEDA